MSTLELLAACAAELSERITVLSDRVPPPGTDAIAFQQDNIAEGIEITSLMADCFINLRGAA